MDVGPSVKTRSSSMQSVNSSSFDLKTLTAWQHAISIANEDLAFSFAIQLVPISEVPGKCPNCDNIMELSKEFKSKFEMILSCKCKKTISLSTNTIFQN